MAHIKTSQRMMNDTQIYEANLIAADKFICTQFLIGENDFAKKNFSNQI